MGTTASGLPYPEPTDPVSQGSVAIKNLATPVDLRSRGLLARTTSSGTQDVGAAGAQVLTTAVTLPATRWVRVFVWIAAQQITAASTAINLSIYGNGVAGTRFGAGALALSESIKLGAWHEWKAAAGTFTASCYVVSNAGSLRLEAATCILSIEDVGVQF